jgi:hypothetical protein
MTDMYYGGFEDGFSDREVVQVSCPVSFWGGSEDGFALFTARPGCVYVNFLMINDSICPGQTVNFTDISSGLAGGPGTKFPTKWFWSFEGAEPSTSTVQNPQNILYRNPGTYSVTLTTGNDSAGYMTTTKIDSIHVNVNPTATVDVNSITYVCQCNSIRLTASSGSTYTWSDGETTRSITPLYSGSYTVTVDGCYVLPQPIVVVVDHSLKMEKPVITTSGFDVNGQLPLTANSSTATTYTWKPMNEPGQNIAIDTKYLTDNGTTYDGSVYVIGFDPNGCSDSSSVVNVQVDKGGVCDVALRIELLSFNAIPINNEWIYLKWVSSTEINNDYYTLERSKNGKDYEIIETFKGAGNSSTPKNYSYYDKKPYFGASFYRLKQTDFDGKYEYVGFIMVRLFPKGIDLKRIYPNPVSNIIKYDIKNDFDSLKLKVEVMDLLGRKIKEQNNIILAGDNHYYINVAELESGLYFLKFTTSSNNKEYDKKEVFTWKFVKE